MKLAGNLLFSRFMCLFTILFVCLRVIYLPMMDKLPPPLLPLLRVQARKLLLLVQDVTDKPFKEKMWQYLWAGVIFQYLLWEVKMDINRVRSQLVDNLARQPAKFFSLLVVFHFLFVFDSSFFAFFFWYFLSVLDSFLSWILSSNDDDYCEPAGGLLLNRDWVRLRRHLPLLLI